MSDIFLISFLFGIVFWLSNDRLKGMKKFFYARSGPQTMHAGSVSRFGGLAIFLTLLFVSSVSSRDIEEFDLLRALLLASFPIFVAGILDDIHIIKNPLLRLLIMLPSPLLAIYLIDLQIASVGIGFLDTFLSNYYFQVLFICFALIGISNAFNIIDGYNGLVLAYVVIVQAFLIYNLRLSTFTEEYILFLLSIFFSAIGIFLVNFPFGKIFLGDSGAYLLGYLSAISLIIYHNELSNSPWYVLIMLAYPVTEVVFSVIRKTFRGHSPLQPDEMHFHMLVYKFFTQLNFLPRNLHNSIAAIAIILFNLPFLYFAQTYQFETEKLQNIYLIFVLLYLATYYLLFKSQNKKI